MLPCVAIESPAEIEKRPTEDVKRPTENEKRPTDSLTHLSSPSLQR